MHTPEKTRLAHILFHSPGFFFKQLTDEVDIYQFNVSANNKDVDNSFNLKFHRNDNNENNNNNDSILC